MKKLMLVYNPVAGKGQFVQALPDVIDILVRAGFRVEVWPTNARGDAAEKTALYASDADVIVAAGGDGTLDEVIEGMYRGGADKALGYIPVGSTNDFANSLGLSTNAWIAARSLAEAGITGVDIGCFNDSHFVYVAAFGAFTDVAYSTDQDMKNILGHVAYLLEASKTVWNIKPITMTITAEDKTLEGDFIFGMVTNSVSVGGIKNITGKDVAMDDGLFEVTLIRNPKTVFDLNDIIGALLSGRNETPLLETFKTASITFSSNQDVAWTLDGEYGGSQKESKITVDYRALRLMMDKKLMERAKEDSIL